MQQKEIKILNIRDFTLEKVKKFIDDGYDINTQDTIGNTVIMNAANENKEDIVKYLISSNIYIDINIQNKAGKTALMIAIQNKNKEIIKLILTKKPKINTKDVNGFYLYNYVEKAQNDGISVIIKQYAKKNLQNILIEQNSK